MASSTNLVQEARILAECMDPSMPDYGASSQAARILPMLADEIERLKRDLEEAYRLGAEGWQSASDHAEKIVRMRTVLEECE